MFPSFPLDREYGTGATGRHVLLSISLSRGKLAGMPQPSPEGQNCRLGRCAAGRLLPGKGPPTHLLPGKGPPPTCSLRNGLPTHLLPQEQTSNPGDGLPHAGEMAVQLSSNGLPAKLSHNPRADSRFLSPLIQRTHSFLK